MFVSSKTLQLGARELIKTNHTDYVDPEAIGRKVTLVPFNDVEASNGRDHQVQDDGYFSRLV
jgi:hypothetical protein